MRRNSIKFRLFLYSSVVLSVLSVLSGIVVWQVTARAADEAYDGVLGAAALSISETISIGDNSVSVDLPYASFAILGTSGKNRIFYRIVDPSGKLVTGNPVLGIEKKLLAEDQIVFFDSIYRDNKIRVSQVAQYHQGGGGGGWFNVFVGETRETRDQLSRRLAGFVLFPTMLAIVLAVLLLVLAIRSSFQPLRRIEKMLKKRSPADLSPISPGVPTEVEALVDTINGFMDRLNGTLEGLRRVSADAAHQLRTPLAAIRAVSELALDASPNQPFDDYIRRIHSNAVTATELVNQLMTEARLLHSLETGANEPVDLLHTTNRVLSRIRTECWKAHELPHISVRSDRLANETFNFNPVIINEVLKNIVDNAIKHGKGPITVILSDRADQVIIQVCDRGPGIPVEIRGRVFERFVKNPDEKHGSGLGLAIVHQVIQSCGGEIRLNERKSGGLEVELRLPRWPVVRTNHGA
ncbi:sensor histidine kinase [Pseudovibrio sp. Tun.PSC04-5.I4]|uniref:sensor histidine kinase n=1 Tax=Pseudovibrio sp. Tun.PSC04-5.I4 TaxID=1798213 RepID=UPI0008922A61|nr:sensor histidine kinase [Pseudovibrio sp. Tun.PSC04-5.I4]SDR16672.1 two-component system, OmpR family, sensor histidine kinase TctE [Pseudovibrio sp. Tun.PSC04-5.I4]